MNLVNQPPCDKCHGLDDDMPDCDNCLGTGINLTPAQQLGRLGGQATALKHGKDHYTRISKLAVARRQEIRKRKVSTRAEEERGRAD